jgi:copper chaperone CopZ
MRKASLLAFALLAVFALVLAPSASFACGENAEKTSAKAQCSSKTNATQASSKAACGSKTDAIQAGAKTSGDLKYCSPSAVAACAEKLGVSEEECKALCESGKVKLITISIDGMTCNGCETSVKTALLKTEGVLNVNAVSYKTGQAIVYVDASKVKDEFLTKAVANKGFKAEIIPAVATTTTSGDVKKACSAEAKKACSAEKGTKAEKTAAEGTK